VERGWTAAGVPGAWGGRRSCGGVGRGQARGGGRRSGGGVRAAWGTTGRVGRGRQWLAGRVGAGGSRASTASRAGGREERRKKVKGEKERRSETRVAAVVYLPSVPSARDPALGKDFF
jgi:hypothetical protein